ncbi:hypothetical protein LTR16_004628 [Cryomyces antarcticus]|uniref:Uncharacterized protein n=1 Tax=Cryomyces antarcticus TaxID=329879 RepID=A0ABR0LN02_9PEZI|nr:hypothetical protein LTR39_004192 [Cryomyces antarcticus]KAK5013139.1 hypothetical protein LTR60_004022 [Cryomyces antarcticus]KAK5200867.1 hypothetical protein LTR16_004628 [Cryomyces antarcticus]
MLQRSGVAGSLLALISSSVLFGALETVRRPFDAHLIGHNPQTANSKSAFGPTNSTSTLSSLSPSAERPSTSRASSYSDLEAGLFCAGLPGLGIYADHHPPPINLPPLPPFAPFSPQQHLDSAWRAVHPPLHTFHHVARRSASATNSPALRTIPTPPTVAALRSLSLSSGQHRQYSGRPASTSPSSSSRSSSGSSRTSSTLGRSPLSTMRRADAPDVPIIPEFKRLSNMPLPGAWLQVTAVARGLDDDVAAAAAAAGEALLVPRPLVVRKTRELCFEASKELLRSLDCLDVRVGGEVERYGGLGLGGGMVEGEGVSTLLPGGVLLRA